MASAGCQLLLQLSQQLIGQGPLAMAEVARLYCRMEEQGWMAAGKNGNSDEAMLQCREPAAWAWMPISS